MNWESSKRMWNSLVSVHDWLTVDFVYKLGHATKITLEDYKPFLDATKILKEEQFNLNSEIFRLSKEALEELHQNIISFEKILEYKIQATKEADLILQEKLHEQINEEYNKLVKKFEDKLLYDIKPVIDKKGEELPRFYFPKLDSVGRDVRINSSDNLHTINMGDGNYNERIEGNYVQGDYREGKQSHFNLQGAQFAGGLVNADTVNAEQIGGNITNSNPEPKHNLGDAAAEIRELLQNLEKTNSTRTSAEKMTVAAKAVDEIEKNPTLKLWVIEALLSGQREALKEAIRHPLVNILMTSIDEWQNERDSLEEAYTLQSQKIASIRKAWIIETDPSRKFQYEQQLQSEEGILKKFNDRLNAIE